MKQHYTLKINGETYDTDAEPSESLLDVLRENLYLTGTFFATEVSMPRIIA